MAKQSLAATVWLLICLAAAVLCAQTPQQVGPLGVTPTPAEIELGRKLFFDPRLSIDGTVSCSTCHNPAAGWSDGQQVAVGIRGLRGTRNSPTIINASYTPLVFWDGRVATTLPQALLPLSNPVEMGRQTEEDVVRRLELIPGYVTLFAQVYGIDPVRRSSITADRLAKAIASFEATVTSFDAPVDRFLAGDKSALSADAQIGLRLFDRAGCATCHKPPLWTDNLFHNNGMEWAGKWQVTDMGRYAVTPPGFRTADTVRAFKTPTLREIHRTAPYNHAGTFADLERVVQHYAAGGARWDNRRDPYQDRRVSAIAAQGFTRTQQQYLLIFLREGFAGASYPEIPEPELP